MRLVCALCLLLFYPTLAMATEEASYRVHATLAESIEVRSYAAAIVAETEVSEAEFKSAGNAGFRILASYIFGNNQGKREIAMTAPVAQRTRGSEIAMTAPVAQSSQGDRGWVVSFTMPAQWTWETLPVPNDARVHLRQLPARQVAAIRFSGTWSDAHFAEQRERLLAAVSTAGLRTVGEPWTARYDPPWTPWFMRRNEILVEVAQH